MSAHAARAVRYPWIFDNRIDFMSSDVLEIQKDISDEVFVFPVTLPFCIMLNKVKLYEKGQTLHII